MQQQQSTKTGTMSVDDAALTLAASVVERTRDLLQDGWVKGKLYEGVQGVEGFCIHGALNLAIEEVFGEGVAAGRHHIDGTRMVASGASDVEAIAVAFIVDEAATRYGYRNGGMFLGAAAFNDAPERRLEEVLAVVGSAASRLWEVATDEMVATTPSYAEVDEETAQQFLYAQLS